MFALLLGTINFDKTDVYIAIGTMLLTGLVFFLFWLIRGGKLPSIDTLQDLASLFNTKGGLIILLAAMWIGTLGCTAAICMWAIIKGIDQQNGTLVLLLSVLTSGAWGNVNGALFKTMTGDEVRKNGNGNGNGAQPPTPTPVPTPSGGASVETQPH